MTSIAVARASAAYHVAERHQANVVRIYDRVLRDQRAGFDIPRHHPTHSLALLGEPRGQPLRTHAHPQAEREPRHGVDIEREDRCASATEKARQATSDQRLPRPTLTDERDPQLTSRGAEPAARARNSHRVR